MAAVEPGAAAGSRHPLVGRILDPQAPESLRLSAARGVLPVPAADLIFAQVLLLRDAATAVAQAAATSLAAIDLDSLHAVLRDPGCDPGTLDHFARSGRLTGPALEAAIAHPSIPDTTLEAVAQDPATTADALNLIVTNEVRIIGNPRLLVHLRGNPNLSADNRRRLGELERDFVGKEQMRVRTVPAAAPVEPPPVEPAPEAAAEGAGEAPPVLTEEQEQAFEEELRRTPTETSYRLALQTVVPEADGIFMPCTTFRVIDIIDRLEKETGKTVITSNQASLWECLRLLKIDDPIPGYGKLLTLPNRSAFKGFPR